MRNTTANGVATADAWYAYDAAGRLWKKGYGNGDVAWHSYDTESRLVSLGITSNTSLVMCFHYLWDAGGNILAITNNLTNVVLYEISFTNGLAEFVTNKWMYDEAGNWLNSPGTGNKWVYKSDKNWATTVTGEDPPSGRPFDE